MPMVREAIDGMSVEEKFSTMDYLWASLSEDSSRLIPAWHERELRATEKRVADGLENSIPWDAAKLILQGVR